ncbi:MAG: hypothetical protein U9O41_07205 [Candidatus Aerophobetes bacterium]|nr:hypothetical protein [Candidatus Aerophobetes bacterium]
MFKFFSLIIGIEDILNFHLAHHNYTFNVKEAIFAMVLNRIFLWLKKRVKDNLKVKEVNLENDRYIICFNPEEAERDRIEREEIIANLKEKIHTGSLNKVLTGDAKTFLKVEDEKISPNKDKIDNEMRFDGKYVLLTDTNLPSDEVL